MGWHALLLSLAPALAWSPEVLLLVSRVLVDVLVVVVHETGPDLEKEFNTFLAQNVIVDSKALRLLHDQLLRHVGLDELNELLEQDELVLGLTVFQVICAAFVIFLHQEMQQANYVILIKLEPQLILTLAEQELDEVVL